MTEADKLDHSIKHLKNRLQTLEQMKTLVEELEMIGEVTISNPKDGPAMNILVRADEPVDQLVKLSKLGTFANNDIIYDPEDKIYKLNKKHRTDR